MAVARAAASNLTLPVTVAVVPRSRDVDPTGGDGNYTDISTLLL
jgi:hypothetical protein